MAKPRSKNERPSPAYDGEPFLALLLGDGMHDDYHRPKRYAEWTDEAHVLALGLTPGASTTEIGAFWIKLYGTLCDMWLVAKGTRDSLNEQDAEADGTQENSLADPDLHDLNDAILVAIEAARSSLSEDELFYLEFRRHYHAHPYVSARSHWARQGTEYISTILGRRRTTILDHRNATDRVEKAHDGDECRAAIAIAAKIAALLPPIAASFRAWIVRSAG